jgi:hypothetical protein
MYDMQGRVVLQRRLTAQAKQVLDISSLPNGTYLLDMVQGTSRYQGKVIKQ